MVSNVFAVNDAIVISTVNGITRKVVTGEPSPEAITFSLLEESGEFNTSIDLFTDGLEDENMGRGIESERINISPDTLFLKNNSRFSVTVTIDTNGVKAGVYTGKIVVHAENAADKEIPMRIEVSEPTWVAFLWNLVGVILGCGLASLSIVVNSKTTGGFRAKANSIFSGPNLLKNLNTQIISVIAFVGVIIILILTTFIAFYPKIVGFGANPLFDYVTAILFGVSQAGASKMLADLVKKQPE